MKPGAVSIVPKINIKAGDKYISEMIASNMYGVRDSNNVRNKSQGLHVAITKLSERTVTSSDTSRSRTVSKIAGVYAPGTSLAPKIKRIAAVIKLTN